VSIVFTVSTLITATTVFTASPVFTASLPKHTGGVPLVVWEYWGWEMVFDRDVNYWLFGKIIYRM